LDTGWIKSFRKILDNERFNLVIPCDDPSTVPLQKHKADLKSHTNLYLLDDQTFATTYNKHNMHELASNLGIPVARGTIIESLSDSIKSISDFQLPLVLKPVSSFRLDTITIHRHEVRKAFTKEELDRYLRDMLRFGPIIMQEHFSGFGAGVEVLAQQGEILTAFQHIRVHEPIHGGGGPYRRSILIDEELYNATEMLMQAIKYTGVAMVEFKIDPQNKRWIFLEINARFWGSLPLAVASGIDFPWYLYEMLVNGRRDFNREYRKGLYCRNLVGDIEWFRDNLRADHSDPFLHTVPIKKVILELKNLLTFNERSDTFTIDDPWPGFVDFYCWAKLKWRAFRRKTALRLRSLAMAKVVERKRAIRLAWETESILFVCTGNICRSPFAGFYAKKVFNSVFSVSSSGLQAVPGTKSPDNAVEAAKEQGIDLKIHNPKALSRQVLEEAGLVFVFDSMNYENLLRQFMWARSKTFYLGTFLPGREIEIHDPDGGSLDTFVETYKAIVQAITNLKSDIICYRGRRTEALLQRQVRNEP
jgi:protein-tyrosine-phosphatase/predicted ATP-grasp superfamily ATP-dependent carboligase